jgi:hypothetical protein
MRGSKDRDAFNFAMIERWHQSGISKTQFCNRFTKRTCKKPITTKPLKR